MCGITGIIARDPLPPEQIDLVARMSDALIHRGPDGAGHFEDRHVALAMRRLSIIDLATGWQPLFNEDRSLALVANGEIYNYVELRRQLESRGHRFSTGSDCENILHLYEEHGDACVDHLRGMFAFALWDSRRRRLLLGRDRIGEKPLYLACFDRKIVFASELKALLGAGVVPFELDPDSVNLYFHYGYVPEPLAAVKGVRKLPAGHVLSVEVDSWRVEQKRYWRLDEAPPVEGDPATLIREELERISEIVIRSDVPVGVALSGGLDSSVIATLAAKKYPGAMHAISVGYVGRPLQDERSDAEQLAKALKMPFHEVELSTSDMVAMLRRMPFERDDPLADVSAVSYYAVLKKARELDVPVMLSGHGGDELFWGYRWVREAVHATERKQALRNGGGARLMDYLQVSKPPYSYTGAMRWLQSLGGLRSGFRQHRIDRRSSADRMVFYDLEPAFQSGERQALAAFTPRFRESVNAERPYGFFTTPRPWPAIDVAVTRMICETYMLENGLAQGDRLSMAHSVELRLPLVDHRLIELVIGLRKTRRDIDLGPKHWLREAVKDVLPPFVLNRRKRGFTPPWRQWNKAISDAFGRQLPDGYLVSQGVLSGRAAKSLAAAVSPPPWGLPNFTAEYALLLEMWCRQMSERVDATEPRHA